MNNYRSSIIGLVVLLLVSSLCFSQTIPFDVGVKVGQRIPRFALTDQQGGTREFASLKGSQGLVLLFFRSADW
jgi:hypothetical protein